MKTIKLLTGVFLLLFATSCRAVSYTHLDVYKRQELNHELIKFFSLGITKSNSTFLYFDNEISYTHLYSLHFSTAFSMSISPVSYTHLDVYKRQQQN